MSFNFYFFHCLISDLLGWRPRLSTVGSSVLTTAAPPDSSTVPDISVSERLRPSSSAAPQTIRARPVASRSRGSMKPPLRSCRILLRLRMQPMSCTAELSSCFSRTASASRQSVEPTASRHRAEGPVTEPAEDSTKTPARPRPRTSTQGSPNHHSSTGSSASRRQCCRVAARCALGSCSNSDISHCFTLRKKAKVRV
uniref:Uncharacterized protein n=1 Tax=Astyanax mexicanus TaxID=7994 RepID=A0A3B1K3I7_ASTMX